MPSSQAASMRRYASSSLSPRPKSAGAEPIPPKLPQPRMRRDIGVRIAGMAGFIVAEEAVESVKVTIDESCGSERLVQRVIRLAPGRSRPRALRGAQQVLFVAAGYGTLF